MIIPITLKVSKQSLDSIKLFEIYDSAKLDKLITSRYLNNEHWLNFSNEKEQLIKYKESTYPNGIIPVIYKRPLGYSYGRVYPKLSMSLCSLRQEIRHTIAGDVYVDIDIQNAHPDIVYQTLKSNNIPCPMLEKYVLNREYYLDFIIQNYKVIRKDAKLLFIILLYFGSFKTWLKNYNLPVDTHKSAIIHKFENERDRWGKIITEMNPDIELQIKINKSKKNILHFREEPTVVALWCQEIEHRILNIIYKYCIDKKYITNEKIGVLCFDGIMIPKANYKDSILIELNKEIKSKMEYDLKFTVKQMNNGYNFNDASTPNTTINDDEKSSENNDFITAINLSSNLEDLDLIERQQDRKFFKDLETMEHGSCAKIFYEQNKNEYLYSIKLGWFRYNNHNVLEPSGFEYPECFLLKISNDIIKFLLPIRSRMRPNNANFIAENRNITKLLKNLDNTRYLKSIAELLKSHYTIKDIDEKIDSNADLFAFTNKVFDLKTYSIRNIKPDDFISKTTKYPYYYSDKNIRKEIIKIFKDVFMIDKDDTDGEAVYNYYIITKVHSLFGNKLEHCYIDVGSGGNGKGTIISTLEKKAFGDYIYFTENTFITSQFRQGAPNPTLADCRGVRQLIISEPAEENEIGRATTINMPFLKTITGNDNITARQLFGRNISFKPLFTPFVQTNSLPYIKKIDDGAKRRIRIRNFPISFVDHPVLGCKYQKRKDMTLKTKLESVEYAREYLLFLFDILNKNKDINKIIVPKLVEQHTSEYFNDNDPLLDFIQNHIVNIEDNRIKSSDVYNEYKSFYPDGMDCKTFVKKMIEHGYKHIKPKGIKYFIGFKIVVSKDSKDSNEKDNNIQETNQDEDSKNNEEQENNQVKIKLVF